MSRLPRIRTSTRPEDGAMVLSVRRGPMTPDVVLLEVRGDLEPSRGEVGILEALAQVLEVRRIATEEAAQLQRDAAEAEALEVGR